MQLNTLENFYSLELKYLILSRYYNAVASMDFININRMGLADEIIYFILFSSFVFWKLACSLFFLGVLFPFD